MSIEADLPDKISLTNHDMENKENADGCDLEKSSAFPSSLNSSAILKQTTRGINCVPDALTPAVSKVGPAELKNPRMSFSHTFLFKRSVKEKQLKTATQNSNAHPPEKHVLGSYRGKIVSSKISSFRKPPENRERKNTTAASAKPVAKTEPRKDRVTNTVAASKAIHVASVQTKPPVKVSVFQPKPIANHDKQPVNEVAIQKKPNKSWAPGLKTVPCNAAKPEQKPDKAVPPTGALAGSVSGSNGIIEHVSASKPAGNRKSTLPQSAEVRRRQLAEWQASKQKALEKPPAPLPTDDGPAIKAQPTVKETGGSFWAAIAEEDEQQLFTDTVNKTLTECLYLIEKGCSADKIHSTLEELVRSIPDAKKLAKYWVCRMRLEQLGTLEKVMAVYEEAILAEAQPKDELRNTLTDVIKNLSGSDGECSKEEIILSCSVEANLDEKGAVQPNSEVKPKEEETSPKAEACLKAEQESLPGDEELRIKESSQTPAECKKEKKVGETQKTGIFKTPDKDNSGSYLIKYNISTTPSLNSMTKKLQAENSDSAIKELKLLTPVRRSQRLQGKVRKLPNMLKDHNPCVSSLEQLGELGGEATAFLYRPNNALQEVLEGQDKM